MGFTVYLLSRFRLVFLPITLVSFPPGVILLNCSTVPRDSATDIEKNLNKARWSKSDPTEA